MTTNAKLSCLALVALVAVTGSCSFDIDNPNSPNIIGENPNRSEVAATANGILIATRADVGDWALDGAIFGREAYRFDGSDPRCVRTGDAVAVSASTGGRPSRETSKLPSGPTPRGRAGGSCVSRMPPAPSMKPGSSRPLPTS